MYPVFKYGAISNAEGTVERYINVNPFNKKMGIVFATGVVVFGICLIGAFKLGADSFELGEYKALDELERRHHEEV